MSERSHMLDGYRVLDFSQIVAGPTTTRLLAEMGAEVIKVESPEGDLLRQVQPSRNKLMGAAFLGANRNKRSVILDLKTPNDRDRLRKLLADADVMISSIRPAALARLSLRLGRPALRVGACEVAANCCLDEDTGRGGAGKGPRAEGRRVPG